MSSNNSRGLQTGGGGGFFADLSLRFKLILRLMGDRRVSPLVKVLPMATGLYFLFPDLAPGPIDDAALIWLGTTLFVELCPPHIVQEHMDNLRKVIPAQWHDPDPEADTVEGEYREADDRRY